MEPILDKITNTYIFEDFKISEKLKQHNINKTISNNHDKTFRKEVEKEITTILENTETSPSNIYFTEDDIKYAIKISNKNSAPGPDRITAELIEHGGETLTKSITLLMQASYSIGYISEEWKRENKIYIQKSEKTNYHQVNSYRPLSLLSTLGKIYERIILQEAVNLLEQSQFFQSKSLYAYQKNKNTPQAILPLVEKTNEAITKNKYGIAIMADLEGAFDSVWRLGALYKLHKGGISENLLLIFPSFMRNHQKKTLLDTNVDEWSTSETGVPQRSILSQLIFLVYTAGMTAEEKNKSGNESNESKYVDDFNFWRLHNNYYTFLDNFQFAITNLQTWSSKWQIPLNISKTNYLVFYDKKSYYHQEIYQ